MTRFMNGAGHIERQSRSKTEAELDEMLHKANEEIEHAEKNAAIPEDAPQCKAESEEEPVKDYSEDYSEEKLEEFTLTWDDAKMWLFRESIRQQEVREELEEERKRMEKELAKKHKSLEGERESRMQQLDQMEKLVEQKLEILRKEYLVLDKERQKLARDRKKFEEEKETLETIRRYTRPVQNVTYVGMDLLFMGVDNEVALKKRYRDLMKIFHPDNMGGDNSIIQNINHEYDERKKKYS